MARVDVAMQASPEITWPEDLLREKKAKPEFTRVYSHRPEKRINFTRTSLEKRLLPGCLLYAGQAKQPSLEAGPKGELHSSQHVSMTHWCAWAVCTDCKSQGTGFEPGTCRNHLTSLSLSFFIH